MNLVERLRDIHAVGRIEDCLHSTLVCEEAADRIEALEAENAELKIALASTSESSLAEIRRAEPLTDDEIYECERLAAIRYKRHKHSIRGQQITPADDPQWHFARAIERAHGIGEHE